MTLSRAAREAYGPEWEGISSSVRVERAQGRCECTGQCRWRKHLSATRGRCEARNGQAHPYTGSLVVLTVAHLDRNGHEGVHELERLLAMCQGCHLSYDRQV